MLFSSMRLGKREIQISIQVELFNAFFWNMNNSETRQVSICFDKLNMTNKLRHPELVEGFNYLPI